MMRPATLGRSLVMKICVAVSATCAQARSSAGGVEDPAWMRLCRTWACDAGQLAAG